MHRAKSYLEPIAKVVAGLSSSALVFVTDTVTLQRLLVRNFVLNFKFTSSRFAI
jgi:hypothetical protein